eukprot:6035935-Prorocentrum_lima.AAC.1
MSVNVLGAIPMPSAMRCRRRWLVHALGSSRCLHKDCPEMCGTTIRRMCQSGGRPLLPLSLIHI